MNEKVAINRVNAREGEIIVSPKHSSSFLTTSSLTERKQIMSTATLSIKAIKVYPIKEGNLKAYVDISIDDAIIIKGFKVMDGKNGLFVAMPSVQNKRDEKYYETVSCNNTDVKDDLSNTVLAAYKREVPN
jgi:stage V sporulation protein G